MKRWILLVVLAASAWADDKEKKDEPKVMAVAPLEVVAGTTIKLKVRGLKLTDATEVRLGGVVGAIKEKKSADVPTGLEAKEIGDSQLEVEVNVPAEASGKLRCEVTTPAGLALGGGETRVVKADEMVAEKEPNAGFRDAQTIAPGKLLCGRIQEDKDVDVFRLNARKGQQFAVEVQAAQIGSLLDPTVSIFDRDGRLLAIDDDDAGRDVKTTITAPNDGPILIVVSDAHDRGGPWHGYELLVKEAQP